MLRIRELRQSKGIMQKDLAAALSIPANTFNQYETGKREPDNETLSKIADYFDVSTDYLLGRENEQKKIRSSEEERILNLLENDEQLRKLIDAAARLTPAERVVLASYADFQVHELSKEHEK